ncbi:tetratricopeptide repeat protein [Streptomyces verrucosisporus]|uniref:tetratricopeptide repeat protein n=1 Tax=Streptomyces verrucosisporus TaxID=1695161 RepID=UPI0019D02BBB|nr:tetratricopeptide repeat protein [Streptomyces verrucosisporus]MBN3929386.1 tetratricopeptide repeat protein [Streptomyces verrucosisporus]
MATRTPNEGLRRVLTESQWSQSQLALAVNRVGAEAGVPLRYDESAVSHWLSGTRPRKAVRPFLREALSRRLRRPVTLAEIGLEAEEASGGADTVEALMTLGRSDMDPSRRSVLGVGLFSVALTVPGWQDVVGRMEAVRAGRTVRIGRPEVDMVVAMTERISELDDRFGGRHARPMAASFIVNTVSAYLRADAPEPVRKDMLSAASDLCYLTGYMAVDEGLQGLAQQYYLKALELAGAAEDHLTYCTTLRGMSVQAADLGHGPQALRLADAAAAASPQAGPRMRAFLTGQQAYAAAQTGDRRTALAHLKDAETAMEKTESPAGLSGRYDPAALADHTSQVRYELGDISGAVKAKAESNELRQPTQRRSRVRNLAIAAERQMRLGHLEEASATWHSALDEYPHVQSGRVDARIRTMASLIRPHLRNRHARDLHDRTRAVAPSVLRA